MSFQLTTTQLSVLPVVNSQADEVSSSLKSVNLHITKVCNYRCKFCFAHFNQVVNELSAIEWMQILSQLKLAGVEKVTFVGGEPTLVAFLPELVIFAKDLGLVTMIVTNGTKLSAAYIERFAGKLDWIGLSIDSSREDISKQLGRGKGAHVAQTITNANLLRSYGIKLKINTVVTATTWQEDMNDLISELQPDRWKVFQMLPIAGENDAADDLAITSEQFSTFINRHKQNNPVGESNEDMIDSYIMIDPQGRFFSNSTGELIHGQPILEMGVRDAFADAEFKLSKFIERKGMYNWK